MPISRNERIARRRRAQRKRKTALIKRLEKEKPPTEKELDEFTKAIDRDE